MVDTTKNMLNYLICFVIFGLVGHEGMLNFICDKTADPYFSNLVWFIGKHAIELHDCVINDSE